MILKGSQRSGGRDLAVHLMNSTDNEHVRLHELRGFASHDLKSAVLEAEAISLGTKCRQYLFSLSLSPPEYAALSRTKAQAARNPMTILVHPSLELPSHCWQYHMPIK